MAPSAGAKITNQIPISLIISELKIKAIMRNHYPLGQLLFKKQANRKRKSRKQACQGCWADWNPCVPLEMETGKATVVCGTVIPQKIKNRTT
jgi:hypothetical protein